MIDTLADSLGQAGLPEDLLDACSDIIQGVLNFMVDGFAFGFKQFHDLVETFARTELFPTKHGFREEGIELTIDLTGSLTANFVWSTPQPVEKNYCHTSDEYKKTCGITAALADTNSAASTEVDELKEEMKLLKLQMKEQRKMMEKMSRRLKTTKSEKVGMATLMAV